MNRPLSNASVGARTLLAFASLLATPLAMAQATGLVAAYSFDEGTGTTTADRSGNGNNGTLVNGVAWYGAGKYGNAVNFDGTNDRIDVADSSSLDLRSGMTLEAWVRPTASSGYRTVILKEVPGELAYALYAADSDHSSRPSGWARISSSSSYADGTGALPLSVWSHIAVTFDGSSLRMYVNGALTRTTAVSGSMVVSSMPLRIGGNTIWGEYFRGQIDEVRVYNRVLPASDIQTDMSTPITATSGGGTDTTPPQVSLSAPANGAVVSGTINVSASATDNVQVASVQFKLAGENLGAEVTTPPYTVAWNTTSRPNGNYMLAAVARDSNQNLATSTSVVVTVNNATSDTTAPSVSFTAPASNSTVSGTITVSANASDNVGVAGVQFRLDGAALGVEDTNSPYSVSWNTSTATNGSHQLTAVVRDAAGLTSTATRTVTVSNTSTPPPGGGTALTIDGSRTYQTIDGWGVSANSASWNNGELRPALDMLVDTNGSTIWRVVIDNADWEAQNDNSDPQVPNWTYYNAVYSSARFEELWSTIAYLNQKGITDGLMLNFMGRGPTWMGGANLPSNMEDEWVEMVATAAYYGLTVRGLRFGLFAPNNEPDWDGIEGIRMDRWQYARAMRKLSVKLDALGLSALKLVGPDVANTGTGVTDYMPELFKEQAVMLKLDHFALHNYAGQTYGADAAIKNSAYPYKNFWMTEVSNIWDALPQVAQNAAAILVWDGYDSVYQHAILAGRGSNPPNDAGNGPALLAYSTSTRTYTPRKAFYQFAQLFKYVPAGSVRIRASFSSYGVTLFAFTHPVTGRVTLVGRNTNPNNVAFSGVLTNLSATVPSFQLYYTNDSNNLRRGNDVAVANGAFSFSAPAYSVFTLTYAGPGN